MCSLIPATALGVDLPSLADHALEPPRIGRGQRVHQGVDKSRFGHTLGGSIGTDGFLGCAAYARVKPLPLGVVVWSRVGVQVRSFADSLGRHLRRARETRRDPSSPIHRLGRWG